MSAFKSTAQADGENLSLNFEGPIDEDVTFPQVDTGNVKKMKINLAAISSINSVGIREWLDWIRPIAEKVSIVLENCPKSMVFQFNMVEGFLPPRATVSSFYVPYFCDQCDLEKNILFTVGKDIAVDGASLKFATTAQVTVACKEAECKVEMDVTEGKYFRFLLPAK
jgi:hypothetical protein